MPKKFKVNLRSREMLPKYSDEELTILAERVGLKLDQLKKVQALSYQVYGYIGADLAEANEGKPMKRYDLVEVVLDANRIESFAEHNGGKLDPELRDWLGTRSMNYDLEDVYAAVGAAFTYPSYE